MLPQPGSGSNKIAGPQVELANSALQLSAPMDFIL